jgi:hypothetical protein
LQNKHEILIIKINKIMKIRFLSTVVCTLAIAVLIGCGKKDDTKTSDNKDTKTESKKDESNSFDKPISVEFKMEGNMNGTVNAVYFEKKSRSQSNVEVAGQKMTATAYFDGGDYMYMVSEIAGKKMGMKIKKDQYNKKEGEIDPLNFKEQLSKMDKIGTEEILGKTCDIYRAKDSSYQMSIYKEMVPLKFSSGKGKVVMTATKFDTDAKVDDNTFTPPKDITYMDAGEMIKDMKDMKNPTDKMKNLEEKKKEMEDLMKKYKK